MDRPKGLDHLPLGPDPRTSFPQSAENAQASGPQAGLS